MLAFIGINPSTAHPNDLDNTVTRVQRFCVDNGYDGWIMLNVYPQRATDPDDMHAQVDQAIHNENCVQIRKFMREIGELDVCAAWGIEIDRRPFLVNCLSDVAEAIGFDKRWLHLSALTKDNHPRHPLYLRADAAFSEFDIRNYLENRL